MENKDWEYYSSYNDEISREWTALSKKILEIIKLSRDFPTATFELTGSCGMALAYPPEGDVDCAFVAPDMKTLEAIRNRIASEIEKKNLFAGANYPMGFQCKTKTGLPWLPVCGLKLGKYDGVKLDLTFRTNDQHKIIQDHVKASLTSRFPTVKDREMYVATQHQLAVEKSRSDTQEKRRKAEEEYTTNKEWLIPATKL